MAGRIDKERALKLRKDGWTYQQIAQQSGVSRQAVHIAIGAFHIARVKQLKSTRDSYIKLRNRVLTYYGNGKLACIKCSFADIRALSIDHINNDGAKHRSVNIYRWLHKHNYPEGFQTLCMNCQFIKKSEYNEEQRLISDDISGML